MSNVFNRPSAWIGLEQVYKGYLPKDFTPQHIVEIGVDYGFSLFHFAQDFPIALVVGVDPYGPDACHTDAEAWVKLHLNEFKNVQLILKDSLDAAKEWKLPIDLLHIDAYHYYDNVRQDFEAWYPHVRPGGVVLMHDTRSFPNGVGRLFRELPNRKAEVVEYNGLGIVYKDGYTPDDKCWPDTIGLFEQAGMTQDEANNIG